MFISLQSTKYNALTMGMYVEKNTHKKPLEKETFEFDWYK